MATKIKAMPALTPEKMFTPKRYKTSERINQLAEPRTKPFAGKDPLKMPDMMVTMRKVSPRTLDLAKPRKIEKTLPKEILIPSRVLNATATVRTIELSKPRLSQTLKKKVSEEPKPKPKRKSISNKDCTAMIARLHDNTSKRRSSQQDVATLRKFLTTKVDTSRKQKKEAEKKKKRRMYPVATVGNSDTSIDKVRKSLIESFEQYHGGLQPKLAEAPEVESYLRKNKKSEEAEETKEIPHITSRAARLA